MRYRLIYIILVIFFFFNQENAQAQIASSAIFSVDSVQIGDPIKVDIRIIIPAGIKIKNIDFSDYKNIENQIYQQDTNQLEKYGDIEILDFGTWKHNDIGSPIPSASLQLVSENGQQVIKNTITISIYNMGVFAIPGANVVTETPSEILPTAAKSIQVYLPVKMMQQDSIALNPIKDIMYEKSDFSDYLIYLYILGALLVMIAIGYYFYRNKKKVDQEISEPTVIQLPAHEKALMALSELNSKHWWQNGRIKDYQSGLTHIIRTYLEERYNIRALEMTTDEIMNGLSKVDFDKRYTSPLMEILQVADLVKFAKATPEDDIHTRFMDKAIEFVQQTKEINTALNSEDAL